MVYRAPVLRLVRNDPSALVVWAFAYVYVVVQAIEPDRFTAALQPEQDRSWMVLLLSSTTLSSTGLSDVVPVRAFARSLVTMEQLAGLRYVAVVVSRLVALTVSGRKVRAEDA